MPTPQLPPLQPYAPTTFLERGVALPFTTPQLFGSRGRPGRGAGIELILPNPSGGRGVYVLDWAGLRSFCRPTVHDRHLITKVADLRPITPRTIRHAATEIAAAGMAGEAAMESAMRTMEAERDALIVGNYLLLMTLVEQVDPPPSPTSAPPPQAVAVDTEQRAQRAVARIAGQMDRTPAWVAAALERLTDLLRDIGVRAQATPPRVRRTLDLLRAVRKEIGQWRDQHIENALAAYAGMVCAVADLTLSLTTTMVEDVDRATDSTIRLLRDWADDPAAVARLAILPEWMLDGWEQICLLWRQAASPADQRVALAEIAVLVPVLPREVADRAGIGDDRVNQYRRLVPLNEDWRTGATVFELLARNEELRAVGA